MEKTKSILNLGFFGSILILIISGQSLISAEQRLLPKIIIDCLINEISGEEALKTVVNLSGSPRIRREDEFKGTFYEAEYILENSRKYGLRDTQIEYFPWKYPCWQPIEGELWLVEPKRQKITGLDMVQLCLIENSKDTDITAELIDVGEGTAPSDYVGKDVKGKIVLSEGFEHEVNTLAVHERGALGIISYRSFYPDEYPDMVSWSAFLQPLYETSEKFTFGFMISPRQGNYLKRLLKKNERVVVRAHVRSYTHPGKLDVINSVIKGRDSNGEEIMLMAHLFEYYYKQGTNDNASGSAVILEVARVLTKLIESGEIPRPKRNIRFFWEPEGWGSYAWLRKYPDASSKIKAVIDMDMVGESHLKCGSVFQVLLTPDSLPHFFKDVVTHFTEFIAQRSGLGERIAMQSSSEIIASITGSRTPFYNKINYFNPRLFNESWLSVPHILFHAAPDPFYHSSEDLPDKCDPTQLKRAALLGAASALYMANLEKEDVPKLVSLVLSSSNERLAKERKKALFLLSESEEKEIHQAYKEALNILHKAHSREKRTLLSIATYLNLSHEEEKRLDNLLSEIDFSFIEKYYAYLLNLHQQTKKTIEVSEEEKRLGRLIPRRILGIEYSADYFYLERTLKDQKIKNKLNIFQGGYLIPWECLNLVDGKRSITEIRNALSAEFSPTTITLKMVEEYLFTLEKAGVIEINEIL